MSGKVIATIIPSLSRPGTRYYVNIEKGYCSCPAWRFQKAPASQRTCKHLEALRVQEAA